MLKFVKNFQDHQDEPRSEVDKNDITEILDAVITEEEILAALDKLKSGKSPGIDGIPIDLF